jgi:Holliday junction DNA helicase RuvA
MFQRRTDRRVDSYPCVLNNRGEMIGFLRGRLREKLPHQVVLDVNGVGYQAQIPLSTYGALGALDGEVELLIHTHVREDQIALYGFHTAREKQCFELLISASGVGPSLALRILSGLAVEELIRAVGKGDLAQLTRVPGVGRKIAERMVVELRDKVALMEPVPEGRILAKSDAEEDVLSALLNLGYERRAAEQALERTHGPGGDFDAMLRAALKQLGGVSASADGHGGRR